MPPKARRPYTSREDILRIVELHKAGLSCVRISAQLNIKERTVQNLVKKYGACTPDQIPEKRHGGGVPKKQCPRTLILLKRQVDANPTVTARRLKELNPLLLGETSVRTI